MFKNLPIFIKLLFIIFSINLVLVLAYSTFSQTEPASKGKRRSSEKIFSRDKGQSSTKAFQVNNGQSGEKIFKNNCAGCHLKGENLIKPNKPIIGSSKLTSALVLGQFLESPPPPMPKFKNIANKSDKLDALHSYLISLMGK